MALFATQVLRCSLPRILNSINSQRLFSNFKSAQNVANLYPNSDPNAILRKQPEFQPSSESFGFIPLDELKISYTYSSGPGGQHVNKSKPIRKVSGYFSAKSKVEIRFHVPSASWIPEEVKAKFMQQEANRITKDNFFVIASDRSRQQMLNQADCLERIRRAVRECIDSMKEPEKSPEVLETLQRRQIKATEKRLREKKMSSFTKSQRRAPSLCDL